MSNAAALARAYAQALYVIETPTAQITRRIGQLDPCADAQLRASGCRLCWWIITPCNPRSQRSSAADNASRLARFAAELGQRGWQTCPSHNMAPDGSWQERGFCIFDVEAELMNELADRYEQAAIVGAALDAAPGLHWLMR